MQRLDGNLAVAEVALTVTVGETRCKLPQVALHDRLAAQRTEGLRVGCPAVHQNEFHVPSPRIDDRNRGEAQFDDLECRDLLNAGRAGYDYGFAALHLGLQAARDGKDGGITKSSRDLTRGGKLAVNEVTLMVTV